MNSFFFIFSLGLSYARFLPGILVTSASCPHFFRMTVTQAVWFSFSGIQLPVLNSQVKRNHSNITRDSQHQYENQEGHVEDLVLLFEEKCEPFFSKRGSKYQSWPSF